MPFAHVSQRHSVSILEVQPPTLAERNTKGWLLKVFDQLLMRQPHNVHVYCLYLEVLSRNCPPRPVPVQRSAPPNPPFHLCALKNVGSHNRLPPPLPGVLVQ